MVKQLIASVLCCGISMAAIAQQKQGTIVYERTVNFGAGRNGVNISMPDNPEWQQRINQEMRKPRVSKHELLFANNVSIFKQAVDNTDENVFAENGGGMRFRFGNEVVYTKLNDKTTVEKREIFDRTYIVSDSVKIRKWKIVGETKTILNHVCTKAVSVTEFKRMQNSMVNGVVEKKEVTDTFKVTAWFAMDIPVPVAPPELQGQLPGAVLEADMGRRVFKAISITNDYAEKELKEPTGKYKMTAEEFRKEQEKYMPQNGNRNGGRVFGFGGPPAGGGF